MKRIKLNKKTILIFILILGIGTTLAYFTSNVTIPNIFNSAKYETTTTEEFTSPSNWKPGDTTPKTVITTNNSNMPIRVRISVDESWTDSNDNELNLEENGTLAAILDLDNRQDWIYEDGYYYYKYNLQPNESTSSFIKSVTFNKDIVGEYICVTENNVEQCDSASSTYQDANYKLDIKVETTQADNYLDSWGLARAPRRVAPTYCTYEGELVQGAEYVNGQYTYRYQQNQNSTGGWSNVTNDENIGWGVSITDRDSTDPVTTPLCTYINDLPVLWGNYMFYNSKTTSIDTSSFDTSEMLKMVSMFSNMENITELDLSNFETNKVINMGSMFYNNSVKNLDLSSFDTSNVTNMASMFRNAQATTINVSSFNTSKVTNMNYMFNDAQVNTLDLSNFDTSNVTFMSSMFEGSQATTLDLSHFNTSNVTIMSYMFQNSKVKNLNISNFNTAKVNSMTYMFAETVLEEIDLSHFDTSSVTNMKNMFEGAEATSIDLRGFDTSNVTTMYQMFVEANDLEEIKGIEDFDTSRVTTFQEMFWQCNALKRLDLKKWNTQSATTGGLARMFYYCTNLEYLDVSNFDTRLQTDMNRTFGALFKIEHINLANWDTSNVTNMYYFFVDNYKMIDIDMSSFKTSNVKDMAWMFYKNQEITKIYISDLWDTSGLTSSYMMFADNPKLSGDIDNKYTMKPRISNLSLADSSTRTIHVGESITIPTVTATYTDNSVVVKDSEDLIWKSSDLDIAKANLGVVKGIAPGNATITIKSGIVETTFNVVVVE